MSKQDVLNFFERVETDNRLKDRIKVLEGEASGKDADGVSKIIESKLIPLAKDIGFEFTMKDYKNFVEESKNKKSVETVHGMQSLDLEDLDDVSGGKLTAVVSFITGSFCGGAGWDFYR